MYVEKFPKLCFGNKVSLIRALFYFFKQVSETFQKLCFGNQVSLIRESTVLFFETSFRNISETMFRKLVSVYVGLKTAAAIFFLPTVDYKKV